MDRYRINLALGLRAALAQRGVTIAAFAKMIGVDPKNIYTQMARNGIRMQTLPRYAAALDMKPSEFLALCEVPVKQVAQPQVAG